tara:strand:+ start:5325 stop:5444 length:120 start_codon:yes stop_codon:yes gene_type:complete
MSVAKGAAMDELDLKLLQASLALQETALPTAGVKSSPLG